MVERQDSYQRHASLRPGPHHCMAPPVRGRPPRSEPLQTKVVDEADLGDPLAGLQDLERCGGAKEWDRV